MKLRLGTILWKLLYGTFFSHDSTDRGKFSPEFVTIIQLLMAQEDADDTDPNRINAVEHLNSSLARERLVAFYDHIGDCQLRSIDAPVPSKLAISAERNWSLEEQSIYDSLDRFLDNASEDEITEQVLVPLFAALGFGRTVSDGHRERILEYGIDLWMKFNLPTFACSVFWRTGQKKGKIDARGKTRNANVA